MFRRPRSGAVAQRRALLALLLLVVGAALFYATGRPPAGDSVLRTTDATVTTAWAGEPGPAPAAALEPGTSQISAAGATGPPVVAGAAPAMPVTLPASSAPVDRPAAPSPLIRTAAIDGGIAVDEMVVTGGGGPTPTTTVPAASPTTTPPTSAAPPITTTTLAPRGPARAAGAETEVVPLTNADRRAQGLGTLSRDACLDGVASRYAEQMARSGVLAHNSGAGPAVTGCRPAATWGDNVGTSEPCDPALLEQKWMASPSHRANILTGAFQLVGVGAWTDEQGGCWVQVLFST